MLYVIVINLFIISLTDFKSFRETKFHGSIQRLHMERGMNSSDLLGKIRPGSNRARNWSGIGKDGGVKTREKESIRIKSVSNYAEGPKVTSMCCVSTD